MAKRSTDRHGIGAENRVDQAREPGVEVLAPELGQFAGPFSLLPDDPGFPENPEMMRHGRLGDAELDRSAGTGLIASGDSPHDLEPLRIAEGVENARQLDLIPLRVMQLRCVIHSHSPIVRRSSNFWYDVHRTIEQPGRQEMPNHLDTQTTSAAPEHEADAGHKGPSATQLAAVVEAAYILEAVRK
jgi:hypothetical protein